MELQLRGYQALSIEGLKAGFIAKHKNQILCAPCGAGKSECAVSLIERAKNKGKRVMFIVDRIVLVNQISKRLDQYGIEHGVLQAGHWRMRPNLQVQVASAQTLEKRGIPEDLDAVYVDECHAQRKLITKYLQETKAAVIGLTATPFAKGMGKVYTNLVNVTTTNALIEQGFLVPVKMYAAKKIDMTGAKLVAGEWSEKDIEERGMEIVGDIVAEWQDKTTAHFGGPAKTIVFSATVAHGEELCRKFQEAGYNFQQISYKNGDDEARKVLIDEFAKPDSEIMGLVSCEIFTKGFDNPSVMVGVSARPYKRSLSSHIQQLGRVMRASPGKSYGLWLCVARGSRVLTDRGLVPIEKITLSDKIWDGRYFVTHGGAVCNGIQETISYQGLEATPGHLVHTAQGWRTFGECASQQIAITQTGLGRTPVRQSEDYFSACHVARDETQEIHSRSMRVRDVWLSCRNLVIEFGRWAHGRVQELWATGPGIPNVAVRQSSGDARTLQKSIGCWVQKLRRGWCRVSFLWGEGWNALDHGEPRIAGAGRVCATGSNQSGWALRTGKHSLAQRPPQPVEQERKSRGRETSQVQIRASGDSLRGQHAEAFLCDRDVVSGSNREIRETFNKTEREVWDILDCGPRNRFTCEGLLVHNCHSGNSIRFGQDTADIFENGVSGIDDGKLEEKKRAEVSEKELKKLTCTCGCIIPPGATKCPGCGKERKRQSLVEEQAGVMVELNHVTGKPLAKCLQDRQSVWRQLCGYATDKYGNDPERARKWCLAKYRSWYNAWPSSDFVMKDYPVGIDLKRMIIHDNIKYAKGMQKAKKAHV